MAIANKLETRAELRSIIQSDLNVSDSSSLFPPATINSAINRGYVKAYRLFRWPGTEDAKATTTQADHDYYDSPSNFVPDSMWRVQVDGVMYGTKPGGRPMSYHDFLQWKIDNPSSTEKRWAKQWNRYFISPTPTASALAIVVWGQENADVLDDDTDVTIFSYNLPECNEAVILEAKAILKNKGASPKDGQFYSAEAKGILAVAYARISQDTAQEEKIQPMLNVPDFFGSGSQTQVTGNFVNRENL